MDIGGAAKEADALTEVPASIGAEGARTEGGERAGAVRSVELLSEAEEEIGRAPELGEESRSLECDAGWVGRDGNNLVPARTRECADQCTTRQAVRPTAYE